ncbi:MAG: hypothetical protein LZF62_50103 [Nitrospira sp.]|nr:MAG: hypothetical protein LZF62_50103 [Nitrospira sp.]
MSTVTPQSAETAGPMQLLIVAALDWLSQSEALRAP